MSMQAILASLVLSSSCSALSLQDIADWKIQGERQPGKCAQYAFSLNYRLSQQGIESTMIAYDWNKRKPYGHALVIFSLNDNWYGIDNETDKPKQLKGNTDLERVQSFDRRAYQTREINFGSPKEYQELADSITSE